MNYFFIFFFLAGWFSAFVGFEVSPMFGNLIGVVSFCLLSLLVFLRRVRE